MIRAEDARKNAQLANDNIEKLVANFGPLIEKYSLDGKFDMTSHSMSQLSFTTDEFERISGGKEHQLNIMKKVVDKLKAYGYRVEIRTENKTSEGGWGMDPDETPRKYKDHYILVCW